MIEPAQTRTGAVTGALLQASAGAVLAHVFHKPLWLGAGLSLTAGAVAAPHVQRPFMMLDEAPERALAQIATDPTRIGRNIGDWLARTLGEKR